MTAHRPMIWIATLLILTLTCIAQSPAPADLNSDSHARLPYVQRKGLDEPAQKIYDVLPGRRPDGSLSGPLAFAAYNPAVAKALFDLHNAAVAGTLNPHVRELAILVACRETNYNLEWNAHEPSAVRAGVDSKVIDIVRRNDAIAGIDEQDATVIRFGRQLFAEKKVDSATFAKAVQFFGQRGVMDMVAVMNTYAVSGFYGIAVDEQPAAGRPALQRAR